MRKCLQDENEAAAKRNFAHNYTLISEKQLAFSINILFQQGVQTDHFRSVVGRYQKLLWPFISSLAAGQSMHDAACTLPNFSLLRPFPAIFGDNAPGQIQHPWMFRFAPVQALIDYAWLPCAALFWLTPIVFCGLLQFMRAVFTFQLLFCLVWPIDGLCCLCPFYWPGAGSGGVLATCRPYQAPSGLFLYCIQVAHDYQLQY